MTDRTTDEVVTPESEHDETDDSVKAGQGDDFEAKYKELQAEFTKKSQKLAEYEKKQQEDQSTEEEKQLLQWIREQGFVDKQSLEQQTEQMKNEQQFEELLKIYPNLRGSEKAIRDLQSVHGGSFEEIAINYNFTTKDKLEKARESRDMMVGSDPRKKPQTKSIHDMTSEEYNKWKESIKRGQDKFQRVDSF